MGTIVSFLSGLLFGIGLIVAGMTDPARIIAFLDVTGDWDPSLAFVMGGALVTTFVGYRLVLKRPKPAFADAFSLPTKTAIDRPLIVGAAVFGAGWGLSGLCPGPALAGLATGDPILLAFIVAMLGGMLAHDRWAAARAMRVPAAPAGA